MAKSGSTNLRLTALARSVPKLYPRRGPLAAKFFTVPETSNTGEMRRILVSAIKVLISVALLFIALRKANFSDLASRIDLASVGWIALAIAATFLQIFVGVLRWRIVSAECGAPIPIRQAMRYNLIGTFFNQTLPSSIGGDAVRLWLVARSGAGWRAATYSIFVDRAVGLIAL